jgi:hypothetical protein
MVFVSPKNTFLTYFFNPKYLGNILETLSNQSMVSKNIKDISKTQNQPETKILKELRSLFLVFSR